MLEYNYLIVESILFILLDNCKKTIYPVTYSKWPKVDKSTENSTIENDKEDYVL